MYVKVRHSVRIRLLLASLGLEAVQGFARNFSCAASEQQSERSATIVVTVGC